MINSDNMNKILENDLNSHYNNKNSNKGQFAQINLRTLK